MLIKCNNLVIYRFKIDTIVKKLVDIINCSETAIFILPLKHFKREFKAKLRVYNSPMKWKNGVT